MLRVSFMKKNVKMVAAVVAIPPVKKMYRLEELSELAYIIKGGKTARRNTISKARTVAMLMALSCIISAM